jgi:AmmeMemoRadiSam system protein B
MRKILIIIACLVFAGCNSDMIGDELTTPPPDGAATPREGNSRPTLNCNFHVQQDFDIYTAQAEIYEITGEIVTGVIPHHLLAGRLIAGFFETAALNRSDIETIVIIAPMHYYESGVVLCTTLSDWAAPFGTVYTERGFAERFISELGAEVCDYNLEKDHSAAALIPFIQHYFPEVGVACLLIEANAHHNLPQNLAPLLAQFAAEKNCLFIFSVDFSHYLKPAEIYQKDEETRAAIIEGDTDRIARMDNSNVDSPRSIVTFLLLNELLGLGLHQLDHSNSMEISGVAFPHPDYDEGLTSYFVFAGAN